MITSKKVWLSLSVMAVLIVLLTSACGGGGVTTTEETQENSEGETEFTTMTDVGTYRGETLIVDQGLGIAANPDNFNPFFSPSTLMAGFSQLNTSFLWEMDTATGEQFPAMAAEPLIALNPSFMKFQIKLREGIYWSDGVEFTAEDVAYTFRLYFDNPNFTYGATIKTLIKDSVEIVDDYTLNIETNMPMPRLQEILGVTKVYSPFVVVPKHIWENIDPVTFANNPPVGAGPYTLKDFDPNGAWYLWERREDWERTDVGMLEGMPAPKYVLFKAYGTEEKRILAAIENDLDIMMDITPESWEILRTSNDEAEAWYENFPWADFDDPCERGMMLNWAVPPYDMVEVRWALALATDMVSISQATYDGMLRVSVLAVPPIEILQQTYHFPMTEWLMEFALPDGYQPFDPDYAFKIADALRANGVEGIPEDEEAIKEMFGAGWWKYDVEEAGKLLESVGFTKNEDGKWLLPDGTLWTINIVSTANYEAESERLSYAVAESWNNFGIDTVVNGMDPGTWSSTIVTGSFGVANHWSGACASNPDIYTNMSYWHTRFVLPVGAVSTQNANRVNSEAITASLDAMSMVIEKEPVIALAKDFLKQMVTEMTWIPMVGTSKFVPVTTHWWDGFPNAENYYNGPWWWWSCFKYIVPHLTESGNL